METATADLFFCTGHLADLFQARAEIMAYATPRQRQIMESRHIPKAKRDKLILSDRVLLCIVQQLHRLNAMIKMTMCRMLKLYLDNANVSSEMQEFIRYDITMRKNDADALTMNANALLTACSMN